MLQKEKLVAKKITKQNTLNSLIAEKETHGKNRKVGDIN